VDSFRAFKTDVEPDLEHLSDLRDFIDAFSAMGNLPNTSRNAYLNTVKAMLLIFELTKATFVMGENDYLEVIRGKLS
jgi:hypothetical protein